MLLPITADDVIVGIFYRIQQHTLEKVTADREKLHRAFHKIKSLFPDLMSEFTFREREIFPESSQLDQALSNLDAAGLISRQNLTPRYYRFENPLSSSYDRFSKRILLDAGFDERMIDSAACSIEKLIADEH